MANTTKKSTGAKKSTTKKTQQFEDWFANSVNSVTLVGVVKRIIVNTDSVIKFSLDTVTETPNGKFAHSFITCTTFNTENDINEGDEVIISGYLQTNSYNGKYSTEVIFDEVLDDIP